MSETAHSARLQLTVACEALQHLNALQIVHLPLEQPPPECWCKGPGECGHPAAERLEKMLRKHMKDVEEWAMDCLKKSKMGRLEGEGGERATLRIIEFGHDHRSRSSVNVKTYEL